MTVYRIDFAYDGSGFRGYASQDGQRTVQRELENALQTLFRSPVSTAVAGRTDAGVHALGQVVSFEFNGEFDPARVVRGLNGILGPEISVVSLEVAPERFNARFSATSRRYRYLIDMSPAADPLTRRHVWHVARGLDIDEMATAAAAFVGEHDFSSFCRSVEGKSNVRRLSELTLSTSDGLVETWIEANAFCHQMVRSIIGYLYDVGRGYSDGSLVTEVIEDRDRSPVATVAPSHGLTLMAVGYD